MKYEFDALVFIGRFQPFHKAHKAIVLDATKRAEQVIVVVGSSFGSRNTRNPFTFEERKAMIKAEFPSENVIVVPVMDYPYNDNKWMSAVQSAVYSSIRFHAGPINIGLIGHAKDHSSYYLKMFPSWGSIDVVLENEIHATDIRRDLFVESDGYNATFNNVPRYAYQALIGALNSGDWAERMMDEFKMVSDYKEQWKDSPYPPTFQTTDTVVVQSGHVLLIRRKHSPGKGYWALPGGFLDVTETILDGAIRELKEETRIKVPVPVLRGSIKDTHTFDAPNRSERGRTITNAFFIDLGFDKVLPKVKAADDAEEVKWVPFKDVDPRDMFEDHFAIIDYFTNIG